MNWDDLTEHHFRGNILLYKNNQIQLQKSCGYADLPNRVSNGPDTKFATASAGKVFVAVGILRLIEQGLLKLDDCLGNILHMDLKQLDPAVTVEELLSHTSGIPDYFDENVMTDYEELWAHYPNYKIRSNSDLLPLFLHKPMMYPHGSKFQYNNAGFVMLAMIIEKVTGKAFDQYLDQAVFTPCRMTDTGYYELDRLPAKCANSYIYDEQRDSYRTNIYSVDAKGTGAGGAFTTVKDIGLFWEHLLGGKLLGAAVLENMLTDHSGGHRCYGLGIWLKPCGEYCIPYFQGSDPGVSFISCCDIRRGYMAVLVSNYGDDVWELLQSLERE